MISTWLNRGLIACMLLGGTLLPAAEKIQLFNGKNLDGWTHYLWDNKAKAQDTKTPMSDVWSIEDGILICQGNPSGSVSYTHLRAHET